MGVALFVTFERDIIGVNGWDMDGKILAQNLDQLDEAARRLGLSPLLEFHSASPEQYEQLLDDWDDSFEPTDGQTQSPTPSDESRAHAAADELRALGEEIEEIEDVLNDMRDEGLPAEQWFSPIEGLETVQGLITHIRRNPNEFSQADDLLVDLELVQRYLLKAQGAGTRFHLSFDL